MLALEEIVEVDECLGLPGGAVVERSGFLEELPDRRILAGELSEIGLQARRAVAIP